MRKIFPVLFILVAVFISPASTAWENEEMVVVQIHKCEVDHALSPKDSILVSGCFVWKTARLNFYEEGELIDTAYRTKVTVTRQTDNRFACAEEEYFLCTVKVRPWKYVLTCTLEGEQPARHKKGPWREKQRTQEQEEKRSRVAAR